MQNGIPDIQKKNYAAAGILGAFGAYDKKPTWAIGFAAHCPHSPMALSAFNALFHSYRVQSVASTTTSPPSPSGYRLTCSDPARLPSPGLPVVLDLPHVPCEVVHPHPVYYPFFYPFFSAGFGSIFLLVCTRRVSREFAVVSTPFRRPKSAEKGRYFFSVNLRATLV